MIARLAFLLLMLFPLATGCAAQRDSTDGSTPPPLGPSLPVVLFGTWDFAMTSGDEVLTGMLSIPDEGEGRITASNGIDGPVVVERADVTGQTFRASGVVQAERGPLPFVLTGIIQGDQMTGEGDLAGVTYELTATRVGE